MEAEIRNIHKKYARKEVLCGASFRAVSGSCVGILGANGTGKSTLLRVLAGAARAERGEFLWGGEDLLKNSALRRKTVAYVPQGTPLIEELSARDNLRLWYEPEVLERSLAEGMLRELGVNEFLNTVAGRLSGGMRKRLSIGCAIAREPAILLLDEPTAALDMPGKDRILRYLDGFQRAGGLVLMASHDPWELALCDAWQLLRGGALEPYVYSGERAKLMRDLETP